MKKFIPYHLKWEKTSYVEFDGEYIWSGGICIEVIKHKITKQISFCADNSNWIKKNSSFKQAKIEAIKFALELTNKKVAEIKSLLDYEVKK